MEKECRFGHICTSSCRNVYGCPCQADHCCAMTDDCDGTCDDCFNKEQIPDLLSAIKVCQEAGYTVEKKELFQLEEMYFHITDHGNIIGQEYKGTEHDKNRCSFGNAFSSRILAEQSRDKVKEVLKELAGK